MKEKDKNESTMHEQRSVGMPQRPGERKTIDPNRTQGTVHRGTKDSKRCKANN
jgi:hypothetical protein